MASAMYRKATWFRVATLCLAFVFVVGFTGIGSAVPAPNGDRGEKTESGDAPPPDTDTVVQIDEKAPAALDPDKQDETYSEPVPPDLEAAGEAVAEEPVAVQSTVVNPSAIVPSVEDVQVIPALSPLPADPADLNSNLMGWNSESGVWTNGNLGKNYSEGDWVTYRITIQNLRSEPKTLPAFGIEYDYYNGHSTSGAIAVDKTKEWTFAPSTSPLANPLTDPLPGVSITPTSDDDALMPGTVPVGDTSARHVVRFDTSVSNTLVVPADGTVVVYFRAHLSITAWWQQQANLNGIGSYPGSSAQLAMNGVGAQTVPIPVPPAPESMVNGLKFYDLAPLGSYEGGSGERGLDGWSFTLRGGSDGFFYTLSAESADGGEFNFGPLPPGAYSLTEEISAPWASAYPSPMAVFIPAASSVTLATKPPGPANVCVKIGNYVDAHPAITVTKTPSATKIVAGESVTYTYVVLNTGDVPLRDITAVDDKLDLSGVSIPDLDVGEDYTFTATTSLADTTTNVVDVTAWDEYEHEVTATDNATVVVIDPEVGIVKTVDKAHILVGESVVYSYLVSNDGDAPLSDIEVNDDKLGLVGSSSSLAVNGSTTFTKGTSLLVDTSNVATVTAFDEFQNEYVDTDEAMVWVHDPSISIVKSADPVVIIPGELVLYTYIVTNTGDMVLYDVTVTDDKLVGVIGTLPMLPVGGFTVFTATVPISEDTTNVGTAVGRYEVADTDFGGFVRDTSEVFVDVVNPAISIEKTASTDRMVTGSQVTYTYKVTNTGDVPLENISALDDKLDITGFLIPDLSVDASFTFTAQTTLTQTTMNTVEVTGFDLEGHPVSAMDSATVEVINPSVSILKSVDNEHILVDGSVEYTYVVTNDGDAPLGGITVEDDKLGPIGSVGTLAPSASETFTAIASLSADTSNVATVTAFDEFQNEYVDTAEAMVWVHNPGISIVKSADPLVIVEGESVMYSYLVTNTGDMDLFDVDVTDNLLGPIDTIDFLPVGTSDTVSITVQITEDTTNIGTAVGHYEIPDTSFGGVVEDDSAAIVDVVHPAIMIVKSPSESIVVNGSLVTYEYTVTNTGDVPLENISAIDDKLDITGVSIPDLGVGEHFTFQVSTTLTNTTTNVVDVVGFDEWEHEVTSSDEATVEVVNPALGIVKTADPTVILAGETVTYTYVVTNEGDYPLHSMVVEDDKLGVVGIGAGLFAPGASETFIATSVINVDTTNVATVTAGYGWLNDVAEYLADGWLEASDDAVVDVVNPAISVVKSSDAPTFGIEGGADTPVTYKYVVTNTGDVDLVDTILTDDKLGQIADIGDLAVGESVNIEVTAILSPDETDGPITNVATVEAFDEYEHPVSDTDTHTIDVFGPPFTPPDMMLVKTADKTIADPGDLITYTLKWTNVGEGASQGFTIIDEFDDTYLTVVNAGGGKASGDTITWEIGSAAPGATGSVTYTLRVASTMPVGTTNLDNAAVIIEPTDENPLNDRDTWRVKVTVGEPFLPFTGGQMALLIFAALGLGVLGTMFRRISVMRHSS